MLNVMLNLILFAVKLVGGRLSNSVAVTSDAFNNLADAATTMFVWLGLRVSSVGAGEKHPNGHGRFEWVIALIAACSVVVVGWELLQQSVEVIMHPEKLIFEAFTFFALVLSIAVKVFMFLYNRKKGNETHSESLKAVAADCVSDAAATTLVLISLLVSRAFSVNIDGWCGILVSLFIMYNGINSFVQATQRVMGHSAPAEQLDELRGFALENRDIREILNLQVEDYGFGRFKVSMTAVGKEGVGAERLLAAASDLRYRIFERYGYKALIMAEEDSGKSAEIRKYIDGVISGIAYPLTVRALRTSSAGDYQLAEVEVGVDFMDYIKKDDFEKTLSEKFADPPEGYKVLVRIIVKEPRKKQKGE